MKELLGLLKEAGFAPSTLAQALIAAGAFTVLAMLGTGLSAGSALPMLVGAFVIALAVIAGIKAALAWRAHRAGEEGGE